MGALAFIVLLGLWLLWLPLKWSWLIMVWVVKVALIPLLMFVIASVAAMRKKAA